MGITWETIRFVAGDRLADIGGGALARYREVAPLFRVAGQMEGVPWPLLAGVAGLESAFDVRARNAESGAAGLMQIIPSNWPKLVNRGVWTRQEDVWNPLQNIRGGAIILKDCGLGEKPIRDVLACYGGFRTKDPSDYVAAVLARANVLAIMGAT